MGLQDLFEILRPTESKVKSNKPIKRNYKNNDGEQPPRTREEYKKGKERDR